MIRRLPGLLMALWLAVTSGVLGSVANAQEPFPEAKLESFATAFLAVNDVVERWRPQMQSAKSEDEMRTMAQEAEAEMRGAVEQIDGITVEEYGSIVRAAKTDPALMAQIETIVAERTGESQ